MEAYDLPFRNRPLELSIGVLSGRILQKVFNLFSLLRNLHHSKIRDFPLRLRSSPLKIFSQINQSGMERKSEQDFSFKFVIDLLDHEAMLGDIICKLEFFDLERKLIIGHTHQFLNIDVALSGIDLVIFALVQGFALDVSLVCFFIFLFCDVQAFLAITDVDIRLTADISTLFLGQFQLNWAQLVILLRLVGLSIRNVNKFRLNQNLPVITFDRVDTQDHPWHQMPQNIVVLPFILILFDLPKTVIETKLRSLLSFQLL